ncbi:unnamed protein product [Vicia faba]|uniref:Uncharacterized protein n=1 Tax=Vicia faba TaxID=3906 RepID=A0AAV0ZDT4_VICFA|nr:unnamed protein product [Vicia faba]
MVAEIKITKPVVCLALRKAPPNKAAMLNKPGMERTAGKFGNRPRDFTYDVSKADEIYDCLEKVGSVYSIDRGILLARTACRIARAKPKTIIPIVRFFVLALLGYFKPRSGRWVGDRGMHPRAYFLVVACNIINEKTWQALFSCLMLSPSKLMLKSIHLHWWSLSSLIACASLRPGFKPLIVR